MFPLSDSIKANRFPFLNYILIAITVFVFIQQLGNPDGIIASYALIPAKVVLGDFTTFLPFITAIFLHGGFLHIISNMWFLKVFGDNVEGVLNPLAFLLLYFIAGIAGNVVQFLFMSNSAIPMLGASGAVAGILGCYLILFPHAKIKTLLFIFFFVTITRISATFMLGYWFLLQIISAIGSIPEMGNQGGVAFFAHVAGFVVGIIFGKIYKSKAQSYEVHYE
ncbi:MAG TPA: rhomboid family intramembrane serine protease [Candidatus Limnocylindrales bacterium]|nr:rhomboid family intramembrane serine protease [Candidatus Limnocylindrales bacterium]